MGSKVPRTGTAAECYPSPAGIALFCLALPAVSCSVVKTVPLPKTAGDPLPAREPLVTPADSTARTVAVEGDVNVLEER